MYGLHEKRLKRQGEKSMLTVIIVIALFIVLDVAALRWGVDSREALNSVEWERRLNWIR